MTTKPCRRCGRVLALDAFTTSSREDDGLDRWCRRCKADAARAYREAQRSEPEPEPFQINPEPIKRGRTGRPGRACQHRPKGAGDDAWITHDSACAMARRFGVRSHTVTHWCNGRRPWHRMFRCYDFRWAEVWP